MAGMDSNWQGWSIEEKDWKPNSLDIGKRNLI